MAGNPPSTPESPISGGFNTDQLPRTSENFSSPSSSSGDEAAVDPQIIRDDDLEDLPNDDEEGDGEDLFQENFMESVSFSLIL